MTHKKGPDLFTGPGPRSLRDLRLPRKLTLLALGPHPDDFDAIGVTLRFLSGNGRALQVGVVRTGSGVEDAYVAHPTRAAKAALREAEQEASARLFGLTDEQLTFLTLEMDAEDQPLDGAGNEAALAAYLGEERPDWVFLPHGNDTNTGHQRMYAMFRRIAAAAGRPITAFLIRDPKTIQLRLDAYTPFGEEEAQWKGALLRCHDSQHQRNLRTRGHGFDDRILNVNRQIAAEIAGCPSPYAEAFEVERFG